MQGARKTLNKGRFDKTALTAYAAACLLYSSGQRSGVITSLRIIEFNQHQPCDDQVVINCLHHKTGPQGLAHSVVTRKLLVYYYNTVHHKIRAINLADSS